MTASPTTRRVLIVCTANVIRSPFVEHLLRARLGGLDVARWQIESAGSLARPGRPAESRVVEIARLRGLDLVEHRARRLDESMLDPGITVLCAAATHRRTVLDMRPDLLDSTFTVREFARLLEAADRPRGGVHDWFSLVHHVSRHRTRARAGSAAEDDLVDPIGQPPAVWAEFEDRAVAAVDTIVRRIGLMDPGGATPLTPARVPRTRREMRALRASGASPR